MMRIDELDFSVRTWGCLKRAGIDTVEQLSEMSDEDLMRIRNLGRKCFAEVRSKVPVRANHVIIRSMKPCHMCDSAFVNEELTRYNDLSYVSLGDFFLGYRALLRSGDGKPVEIITEHWNGQEWEEVGRYRPAFCPNCGRELVENQQFKPLDSSAFSRFYSPELVHMATSDEVVQMIKEGF